MEPITVKYKVLDARAKVPAYATPGAAQNVIDLFLVAKREQRSFRARCPSAALSDVRLWGHASGFDV